MILSDKNSRRIGYGLVLLCILAYVAVFAVINIFGFELFCDSDMYPDTLIARLMWEQKTLFPDGWVFGNQLYVIATPALAAVLYGITGSMNTAMVIATEIMSVLIMASFLWVLGGIRSSRLDKASCCLLLIASVLAPNGVYAENAQLFFIQASYYACYLITLFVVYGDYIRGFQTDRLRPGALGLCAALCFATGMQSMRQTVVMVLPILCCEVYIFLRGLLLGRRPQYPHRQHILRAVIYAAANAAGVLWVKLLDIPQISIIGDLSVITAENYLSRLATIFDAFLGISGLMYVGDPQYHWFYGFFAVVQLLCCAGAGVIFIKRFRTARSAPELCWLLCLIGMAGVAASSLLFNLTIRVIYFFLYYPFVAFSWLILLQELKPGLKRIAVLLLCVLSIGNLFHSYFLPMELALENSPTIVGKAYRLARAYGLPGKAWQMEDKLHAREMSEWAVSEGYRYVYGNWEIVPHVAIASDGELVAGYWYPMDAYYDPVAYINIQNIYEDADNEKALYIFASRDLEQGLAVAAEMGVELTRVAEFGDYYAYTSPVQLMGRRERTS